MARAHKEVRFTFTTLGGSTGDVNTGTSTSGCCLNPTEASAPKISAVSCGKRSGTIGGATMSVFTNDFQGAQKQIQLEMRGGTPQQLANTRN